MTLQSCKDTYQEYSLGNGLFCGARSLFFVLLRPLSARMLNIRIISEPSRQQFRAPAVFVSSARSFERKRPQNVDALCVDRCRFLLGQILMTVEAENFHIL